MSYFITFIYLLSRALQKYNKIDKIQKAFHVFNIMESLFIILINILFTISQFVYKTFVSVNPFSLAPDFFCMLPAYIHKNSQKPSSKLPERNNHILPLYQESSCLYRKAQGSSGKSFQYFVRLYCCQMAQDSLQHPLDR